MKRVVKGLNATLQVSSILIGYPLPPKSRKGPAPESILRELEDDVDLMVHPAKAYFVLKYAFDITHGTI